MAGSVYWTGQASDIQDKRYCSGGRSMLRHSSTRPGRRRGKTSNVFTYNILGEHRKRPAIAAAVGGHVQHRALRRGEFS